MLPTFFLQILILHFRCIYKKPKNRLNMGNIYVAPSTYLIQSKLLRCSPKPFKS